jgi:1-acyl-sn-glycerol-3-phosphate acyltransferase
VLYNHQTAFDQFFVGMPFRQQLYYVASEDLFSKGFVSTLLRYLIAPIPIKKQATDLSAVMTCIRLAREGGSIAIAPEGNRTYSGKTEYMNPAIAPMARKMGLPIAFCRIEGGYGVHPRWSDVVRRGHMTCGVSRLLMPEEYKDMTDEQLCEVIRQELYVNEGQADACFYHKKRAEYLERAMYVCPYCGLSTFESHRDTITCKACGRAVRYLPTKELQGVGFTFPFRFVTEWYDYQCDFINHLNPADHTEQPLYEDTVSFSEVIVYKKKQPLCKQARVALYGDRITVADMTFSFHEVSALAVLGKNKLNVYHDKRVYQFKGNKRFNALKYVNLYYRYRNVSKGDNDGKFLGL